MFEMFGSSALYNETNLRLCYSYRKVIKEYLCGKKKNIIKNRRIFHITTNEVESKIKWRCGIIARVHFLRCMNHAFKEDFRNILQLYKTYFCCNFWFRNSAYRINKYIVGFTSLNDVSIFNSGDTMVLRLCRQNYCSAAKLTKHRKPKKLQFFWLD